MKLLCRGLLLSIEKVKNEQFKAKGSKLKKKKEEKRKKNFQRAVVIEAAISKTRQSSMLVGSAPSDLLRIH